MYLVFVTLFILYVTSIVTNTNKLFPSAFCAANILFNLDVYSSGIVQTAIPFSYSLAFMPVAFIIALLLSLNCILTLSMSPPLY